MNIIHKARDFSHAAHDAIGQKRKYTGEPYWKHTDAVASLVTNALVVACGGLALLPHERGMVAAAHLHDTLEDTKVTFGELEKEFGTEVALLVHELTDLYTPENYPGWNRAKRKAAEAARLATISDSAKTIKLADLINNTSDITAHDPDFARTYLREKAVILPGLVGGDERLFARAHEILEASKKILDKSTSVG